METVWITPPKTVENCGNDVEDCGDLWRMVLGLLLIIRRLQRFVEISDFLASEFAGTGTIMATLPILAAMGTSRLSRL